MGKHSISLPEAKLTSADYARNVLQAAIQAVPYMGGSLSQFIFGPLTELRFKRIEQTLSEVAAELDVRGAFSSVANEDFATLLESVLPDLGRSTNEERRQRYRDLLIKSAQLQPGSVLWQDATLCAGLLRDIEPPGLAVLGALAKSPNPQNTIFSKPSPRLYTSEVDFAEPKGDFILLPYQWILIDEWVVRLREKRLVGLSSRDARGGFGGVYLTDLGRFFIEWVMEKPTGTPNPPLPADPPPKTAAGG
jgi:hypothetical protein